MLLCLTPRPRSRYSARPMPTTTDIVQKLWNLCHILRDDGVTYHQYVTELTLLLFLKMAKETNTEDDKGGKPRIPKGRRWDELRKRDGQGLLDFYRETLLNLGKAPNALVQSIYTDASTTIRKPTHLDALVRSIDALDWYSAKTDGLGDLYEGLLEKNASETKSGAGQYFTPRPHIDAIVDCVKPQKGERVQDPAAGTGGFLIAADRYVKDHTDDLFELTEREQKFQREEAFLGLELVPDTVRLGAMNCMLHNIEGQPGSEGPIRRGDTLTSQGVELNKPPPGPNVILTNPPFGTKTGGGKPQRDDFTFPTSNKQLAFVEHVYRALRPGGRAAMVAPDNVLFEEGMGRQIRADLMDKCDVHTILRLPTGIFYAQGVKTNVLFFTRGQRDKGNTKAVWVYDLRANAPGFGKRTPFTREYLEPFVKAYGKDPLGKSKRIDEGEAGRFRKFTREQIAERNDNLDIAWLKDEGHQDADDLPEPEVIAAEIRAELQTALEEIDALTAILNGEDEVAA